MSDHHHHHHHHQVFAHRINAVADDAEELRRCERRESDGDGTLEPIDRSGASRERVELRRERGTWGHREMHTRTHAHTHTHTNARPSAHTHTFSAKQRQPRRANLQSVTTERRQDLSLPALRVAAPASVASAAL